MNNKIQLSLLTITLGLLTACGGGGGSDGGSEQGNNINSGSSISYVRDDFKQQVRDAKTLVVRSQTNDIIQTINLSDSPKGIVRHTVKETEKTFASYLNGVNQAYSASLIFSSNDPRFSRLTQRSQKIYVGLPTESENLPRGVVGYQGESVGSNTKGVLALNADFDNKTVSGRIYNRSQDNGTTLADVELKTSSIRLGGIETISGTHLATTFSGGTLSDRERGSYEGFFMGPNGEEVIGSWTNGVSLNVSEVFAGERR